MVEVTTKIIFGSEAAGQARLAVSPVSQTINTSFVERNNLTCPALVIVSFTPVRSLGDCVGSAYTLRY